ncbi:MAG TPA: AbrB/MazE/SpoVT family DNA-binding domain-containing protein [Limnochordales bacterium]
MATVRVQPRGQITLPKAIRDLFDLREGAELLVVPDGESRIALVVLPKPRSVFDLGDLVDPARGPADFREARKLGRKYRAERLMERLKGALEGRGAREEAMAEAAAALESGEGKKTP